MCLFKVDFCALKLKFMVCVCMCVHNRHTHTGAQTLEYLLAPSFFSPSLPDLPQSTPLSQFVRFIASRQQKQVKTQNVGEQAGLQRCKGSKAPDPQGPQNPQAFGSLGF